MSLQEGSPEWGEFPVIGGIDTRARLNQRLDGVIPSVGASVVQARVATRVGRVRVGAQSQQVAQNARLAVHGCVHGRCAPETVPRRHFRVVLD